MFQLITDQHPAITDKQEKCTHKIRSATTWHHYSQQQPIQDHKLISSTSKIRIQNKKKSSPRQVQHLTESVRVVTASIHRCLSQNNVRRRYNRIIIILQTFVPAMILSNFVHYGILQLQTGALQFVILCKL